LSKRYFVLSLLLVFILTAGLSLAMSPGNNTSKIVENKTAPLSSEKSTANPVNNSSNVASAGVSAVPKTNASETAKAASEIAKMKGIWSITGIKPEQITMALQEDGRDLFGQAKYEPQAGAAWNAVVIGSVSGDTVALVVTSLEGEKQVSAWLNGTFANDAFSGKFFEVSKGNISNRGEFSATLVNPEVTDYSPASATLPTVNQSKTQETAQKAVTSTPGTQASLATVNQTATQKPVTVGGRLKPVDIHEYKDKIGMGGDLSGVPPGMG
jgi:hypothetical protein